ncbi:MAG: bifunctional riboflavin kinase/FAD synthetase [Bdellovibrionales bacterium]|nr:bifunctional riboflavin kinase/FAD synthetase [Bdellovibrionales bacterium]
MQVFRSIEAAKNRFSSVVVTIGNFDGVHLGHRKLISQAQNLAKSLNSHLLIVTFEPHPVKVLAPEKFIKRLYSEEDMIRQLQNLDVDGLLIVPFTKELSKWSARRFFESCILSPNPLAGVVVGYDFVFGADRSGNVENLKKWVGEIGAEFRVVEAQKNDSEVIYSSTKIRHALLIGDVERATGFLGRPFSLAGEVIQGDQRGRQIGFPTANLILPEDQLVPRFGVYLTRVLVDEESYLAVTNIGQRPTFKDDHRVYVESHIVDVEINLYNKNIRVQLLHFLREEKKFKQVSELVEQIKADIQMARRLFSSRFEEQNPYN